MYGGHRFAEPPPKRKKYSKAERLAKGYLETFSPKGSAGYKRLAKYAKDHGWAGVRVIQRSEWDID